MGIRKAVIVALLTVISGCFFPSREQDEGDVDPPNILFIFTDDHDTGAIGAYGGRLAGVAPTPNLDRLASEGMLFRNAFVTNAICAPSRAVILTGKHSHLNGVRDNGIRFDSSQVTFPKLLQDAGYQTAIVGKWHLKSEPTGFDYWNVLPGQGDYYNPRFRTPEGIVQETGYVTDIITDKALDWLENGRDAARPFMLMYQHKAPHRPWLPELEHLTRFENVEIPEPATLFDDYEGRTSAAKTQEMTIARHFMEGWDLKIAGGERWEGIDRQLNEEQRARLLAFYEKENEAYSRLEGDDLVRWKYQRYMKDYLGTIASVDENIGRMLDYLEENDLLENTVVVYSSDQGFFLGEHGWFDKRWMYEESLRTPLIVRWPGVVEPHSENTDLVQNLDFAPTFLDLAGVTVPSEMQGMSLVPLLKGSTPNNWRDAIYYHYYEYPAAHMVQRHYGVRTDRYKLIHYYPIDEWELFDLERDPDELQSVYGDPTYAGVQQELEVKLEELRRQYEVPAEDPMPVEQ